VATSPASGPGSASVLEPIPDALALGLLGATAPLAAIAAAADAFPSGEMRLGAVVLAAGASVAKVGFIHDGSAAGLTLAKAGIYDASFNLVASTASFHGTINGQAGGYHEFALSAAYVVPAFAFYYLGALFVGVTPPALSEVFGSNSNANVAGIYASWRQTGLADLPNPAVRAAGNLAYFYTAA